MRSSRESPIPCAADAGDQPVATGTKPRGEEGGPKRQPAGRPRYEYPAQTYVIRGRGRVGRDRYRPLFQRSRCWYASNVGGRRDLSQQ